MSDMTPENVAQMLEGVTPGPWKCCETTIHGHKYGGCWVEGPDVDDGDGMLHGLLIPISGSGGAKSFTTRLVDIQDHDHNDANARFIAWAREAVPALAARLAVVEAEMQTAERQDFFDVQRRAEAAEAKLAASEAREARLRSALAEAVEVVHKAYVAATMEAVNAGPSHPLKDNFDKWRVRCMNAETAMRAALQATTPRAGDEE